MKFEVEVDTEVDSADVVGETLRAKFWDQKPTKIHKYGRTGCYSSFDYNPDVVELREEIQHFSDRGDGWGADTSKWSCARWRDVKVRWYWDGDGTIEFTLPDGSTLSNTDCKKDYGWSWG